MHRHEVPDQPRTRGMKVIEARIGRPLDEALNDLYHGQRMTLKEIADEWGVAQTTVSLWMRLLGIEARVFGAKNPRKSPQAPAA